MKNKTVALLALVSLLTLSGCGYKPRTEFGKSVAAWWGRPSTQNAIHVAQQAAMQFAVNASLAALQQWAGGGKMDYTRIAVDGGINTLWQQSANIRQLQGTSQVLDPVATARLLEAGGTPEAISRKLAEQLFDNATALIRAGMDPDSAAEVNAAGIDAAAFFLTQKNQSTK